MKKVFLSAIMMIAFVGTSMANDIAEKEVEITDSKEIEVLDVTKTTEKAENGGVHMCNYLATELITNCNSCNLLSDVAYFKAYRLLVDTCMAGLK